MMRDNHLRYVDAACAGGAQATEFRLLLSEQRLAVPAQVGPEPADLLDQRASHRHVDAERRLALLLEHERRGAMVLHGDGSAEVAVFIEPVRFGPAPNRFDRAARVGDAVVFQAVARLPEAIRAMRERRRP